MLSFVSTTSVVFYVGDLCCSFVTNWFRCRCVFPMRIDSILSISILGRLVEASFHWEWGLSRYRFNWNIYRNCKRLKESYNALFLFSHIFISLWFIHLLTFSHTFFPFVPLASPVFMPSPSLVDFSHFCSRWRSISHFFLPSAHSSLQRIFPYHSFLFRPFARFFPSLPLYSHFFWWFFFLSRLVLPSLVTFAKKILGLTPSTSFPQRTSQSAWNKWHQITFNEKKEGTQNKRSFHYLYWSQYLISKLVNTTFNFTPCWFCLRSAIYFRCHLSYGSVCFFRLFFSTIAQSLSVTYSNHEIVELKIHGVQTKVRSKRKNWHACRRGDGQGRQ